MRNLDEQMNELLASAVKSMTCLIHQFASSINNGCISTRMLIPNSTVIYNPTLAFEYKQK